MELLETTDPEKKRLIEATDRHKYELQREVKAISDKTENAVKNVLIIGGTLVLTYLLVSQLGGGKKKKLKKNKTIYILRDIKFSCKAHKKFSTRIIITLEVKIYVKD